MYSNLKLVKKVCHHPFILLRTFYDFIAFFHAIKVLVQLFLAAFMQRLAQMWVIKYPCLSWFSPFISRFAICSQALAALLPLTHT